MPLQKLISGNNNNEWKDSEDGLYAETTIDEQDKKLTIKRFAGSNTLSDYFLNICIPEVKKLEYVSYYRFILFLIGA
jgi:hypothetical protein